MEGIDLSTLDLSSLLAPPPIVTVSAQQLRAVADYVESAGDDVVGADLVNFGGGTVSVRTRTGTSIAASEQSAESERSFDITGTAYEGDDGLEQAIAANEDFITAFEQAREQSAA